MPNDSPSPNEENGKPPFDLEERTAVFGEEVIKFARTIPKNPVTVPLISQVVRAGTSVGANYCEADDAASKKDFKNKICTCRKEARETKLWLRMIAAAEPELKAEARKVVARSKRASPDFCGHLAKMLNYAPFGIGHSLVIRI